MKERPILFSGPMVRALLDGSKTQTRRVVKWRDLQLGLNLSFSGLEVYSYAPGLFTLESCSRNSVESRSSATRCPYGQPGDRLWVRETWNPDPPDVDGWGYTAWAGCRQGQIAGVPEQFRHPRHCNYAADWTGTPLIWTPSIHMPRWASRILLEITDVRVERLQNISEADCIAEGCAQNPNGYFKGGPHPEFGLKQMATARQAYRDLWNSINGAKAWDANPWVWAVSFKRVQP